MEARVAETRVAETGTAESWVMKARPSAHPTERSTAADAPATVAGVAAVAATTLSEGRHYR
jgi:hypothetical protein